MVYAYKLEDGDKREKQDWLARAAAEAGHELPAKALDDSPDLRQDLSFYLQAFHQISTVRPMAFSGVAPLPYDKVIEYAKRSKLTEEDIDEFCEIINGLDSEFRKFLNEESDKKPEANENDGTRNKSNNRPGNKKRGAKG